MNIITKITKILQIRCKNNKKELIANFPTHVFALFFRSLRHRISGNTEENPEEPSEKSGKTH
ncbi:MAG: hypothetical protein ACI350_02555 [Prevotella sp.]